MFYKKEYQKIVAERNAWRNRCLESDREKVALKLKLNKLKENADWLESENAKLRKNDTSTFDKAQYQILMNKNEELREQLKRAEMKLSARDSADKAFKNNCCFGLSFLGETLRELNKQDEAQKRREDFLFRAVEGLTQKNAELTKKLGEEPSKAITIDGRRADGKAEQSEPKKKKT